MAVGITVDTPSAQRRMVGIRRFVAAHPAAAVAAAILILVATFSFLGPVVHHSNQNSSDLLRSYLPPGPGGVLGTDGNGRDVLGQLMLAGRTTLQIAVTAGLLISVVGVTIGLTVGYLGGWIDTAVMRLCDMGLTVRRVFLFLFVTDIWESSVHLLEITLIMTLWFIPARLARAEAIALRDRDYIRAAVGMGAGRARIIFRHLLPNSLGTVVVTTSFQMAEVIVLLALLDFLGFGLPPGVITWGSLFSKGGRWWEADPALALIALTSVCLHLVGDAVADGANVRI